MPTRNVVLTDHQQTLIEDLVSSGRYQNASEVLRDGLRLVERRELDEAARREALRTAVSVGIQSIEGGDFIDFPDVEGAVDHLTGVGDRVLARFPEN